ncbi:DsbA family protein [Acetobacter fallax]|uniref:Thioredoxin domain-containing protein n=1 Tax=Acetobacter fallax TaxID=1737473 RepID=A0ABX0K682_9PROT|nr:thioredoxin domain-containing protein [Acetobacter fallax]NHO31257.1 thioredoxin domain-containing protein [Acetobacter fallax]NHO34814.1 thioredoxin domain-containing protein [Acetobacter fallax]
MSPTRRALLAAALPAVLAPALIRRAMAADDPRMAPRVLGKATAKVTVEEWFSLTCPHCAQFAINVLPEIKTKLIDTGRIRYVFCDYPLDRISLMAAQIARSLPVERYEPFVMALLANQDHWAFVQDGSQEEQLRKMAALAGLSADSFDRAVNDTQLQNEILSEQGKAETQYKITGTPSFRFNNDVYRDGELSYDAFEKKVAAAGG